MRRKSSGNLPIRTFRSEVNHRDCPLVRPSGGSLLVFSVIMVCLGEVAIVFWSEYVERRGVMKEARPKTRMRHYVGESSSSGYSPQFDAFFVFLAYLGLSMFKNALSPFCGRCYRVNTILMSLIDV